MIKWRSRGEIRHRGEPGLPARRIADEHLRRERDGHLGHGPAGHLILVVVIVVVIRSGGLARKRG
jgi:hypothetical protein